MLIAMSPVQSKRICPPQEKPLTSRSGGKESNELALHGVHYSFKTIVSP